MCIFCKIINNEIPSEIVFENDNVIVIKDAFPITDNHTLVIPKQHYKNMIDINSELLAEMIVIVQQVANKHLQENSNVKGYNIIVNNNEEANQAVDHLHIHIVYRSSKDDINYFSKKNEPLTTL